MPVYSSDNFKQTKLVDVGRLPLAVGAGVDWKLAVASQYVASQPLSIDHESVPGRKLEQLQRPQRQLGYWSEPKLLCLRSVRLVCLFRLNQIWKESQHNCHFVTAPDIAIVASMIVSIVVDAVKVDLDLLFVGN